MPVLIISILYFSASENFFLQYIIIINILNSGVATQEMECLLDFMYRGSIDVTEDHLPSLIKIATELEIRGLSADHQNETANSSSGMQRNNLKLSPQPNSTSEENISATANLTPDDMTTTHHIKVEEIEVEDDPMIIDTHEDFEHSLPSTEKPTVSKKKVKIEKFTLSFI